MAPEERVVFPRGVEQGCLGVPRKRLCWSNHHRGAADGRPVHRCHMPGENRPGLSVPLRGRDADPCLLTRRASPGVQLGWGPLSLLIHRQTLCRGVGDVGGWSRMFLPDNCWIPIMRAPPCILSVCGQSLSCSCPPNLWGVAIALLG